MSEKTIPKPITGFSDNPIPLIRIVGSLLECVFICINEKLMRLVFGHKADSVNRSQCPSDVCLKFV